jgi:hypothetical protein
MNIPMTEIERHLYYMYLSLSLYIYIYVYIHTCTKYVTAEFIEGLGNMSVCLSLCFIYVTAP